MGLGCAAGTNASYVPAAPPTGTREHVHMAIAIRVVATYVANCPPVIVFGIISLIILEHGMGFEPMNNGFAVRRVSHFATRASCCRPRFSAQNETHCFLAVGPTNLLTQEAVDYCPVPEPERMQQHMLAQHSVMDIRKLILIL